MSDLFSNMIDRAQGVAPALRPLHAFYRPEKADPNSLLPNDELTETLPKSSVSHQPRIDDSPIVVRGDSGPKEDSYYQSNNANQLDRPATVWLPSDESVHSHTTNLYTNTIHSNALEFRAAVDKPTHTIPDSPNSDRQTLITLHDVSNVRQSQEQLSEQPLIAQATNARATGNDFPPTSPKFSVAIAENASAGSQREVIERYVWDKTALPIADAPSMFVSDGRNVEPVLAGTVSQEPHRANLGQGSRPSNRTIPLRASSFNAPSVVEQEEKHVTVSIARLEVRVNSNAVAKPQVSSAPAVSTLHEYLRERQGGGR